MFARVEKASPITNQSPVKRTLYVNRSDLAMLLGATFMINLFALAVPLVTLQVYDRILSFHNTGTLNVLTAGVIGIVTLDMALRLLRAALIGWASARFEHHAYISILDKIMNARLQALYQHSPGEHLQRLNAISQLKRFYSGQAMIHLVDLPFVFIFIGFIAYLAIELVWIPLVLIVIFGVYALWLARAMNTSLTLRDEDDDNRINLLSEILEHIHTIKMLGLEPAFQRKHEHLQARSIHDSHVLATKSAQGINAASIFTQAMMVAMISFGALAVLNGHITMGVLVACVLLSGRVMQPIQKALSFWLSYQEYKQAKDKIEGLLALPVHQRMAQASLHVPRGKIDIETMCFEYKDGSEVFKNIDLHVPAGRTIALHGPAGNGKTTFLKLICGLYAPTSGRVLIDGMDAHTIPYDAIVQYVGYLPPDATIFQGSIMDNLTSFRPDKEEAALEMAEYLGIDQVVSKLARGYQTQLFDGPADPVTPGMKQRITLARVLVNRPRILLFDFADKSLDREGYNHLFRLLGQLKGQATMIIASNDRNILHLAQEEYVLEDHRLVPADDSQYSKSLSKNTIPFLVRGRL